MGTTNDDYTTNIPFNIRKADYSLLNNDRTHVLVFNYDYHLPKLIQSNAVAAKVAKVIVNDWTVAGITTFQSGAPTGLGFGIAGIGNLNERFTGSPDVGPRIAFSGPLSIPNTTYQYINGSALALPPVKGSQGFDSARYQVRGPGYSNWDVSVFKNIPVHGEKMYAQLRVEMFNAWNHPEFNGFNTGATFNQAGVLTNLPSALGGGGGRFGFGAFTGTNNPRRIQLAAKFYF